MKNKQRNEYIGKGSLCKKCNTQNHILKHRIINDAVLKRKYYYSQWEKCPNCRTIWFDSKYIVSNENDKAKEWLENEEENYINMSRLF